MAIGSVQATPASSAVYPARVMRASRSFKLGFAIYLGACLLLTACAASSAGPSPSQAPETPPSIAGRYECREPGDTGTGPGLHLVWLWELSEDGTLTITDPADTVFEGSWSADVDSGAITMEGVDTPFSIDGDRLVSDTVECTRRAE